MDNLPAEVDGTPIFGRVQSMSYTEGTGDANDIQVACPDVVMAARATQGSGPLTCADEDGDGVCSSWDYFRAVVIANTPYTPDGTETQEFVDMYLCAQQVGRLWNTAGTEAQAQAMTDYMAGEHACGGQIGMDYGGNPSYTAADGTEVECGFAPIVMIIADHAHWPAPGWFSGTLTIDATMNSPIDCQARCFNNADCNCFSYEWELTADAMYHECYLKTAYTDDNTGADVDAASCMADPYVTWASEDAQWHGESGEGIACGTPVETEMACGGLIGMDYGGNPSYGAVASPFV
eukprot:SAG11_NODE_2229_length_3658_cov_3.278730_1_plen_292_part_00